MNTGEHVLSLSMAMYTCICKLSQIPLSYELVLLNSYSFSKPKLKFDFVLTCVYFNGNSAAHCMTVPIAHCINE